MQTEVTMQELWWNKPLMDFFFRQQSIDTLEKLIGSVYESTLEVFDVIESRNCVLDEVEELFYNDSVEELIEWYDLTPIESDKD